MHLPEDCSLEPLCDGCGAYKAHFAHECGAVCARCDISGHSDRYCSRQRNKKGDVLSTRPAVTLLRPNDLPRQIGSVMERIHAEVARYQSAKDPVPRQGTIPLVSGQGTTKSRQQK